VKFFLILSEMKSVTKAVGHKSLRSSRLFPVHILILDLVFVRSLAMLCRFGNFTD
jgi:hypothetical protein